MPDRDWKWDDPLTDKQVDYFLGRLNGHSKIASVHRENNIFSLERKGGLSSVRAWFCNVYTVGLADYHAIRVQDPEVNCIVTMAGYNRWSRDAKEQGYEDSVGVFKFGEFYGALHHDGDDFVHYKPPERARSDA
jgi:hypothetical protein